MEQRPDLSQVAQELARMSTSSKESEQILWTLYRRGLIKPGRIENNQISWVATTYD
jgi:hypothetical protein